MTNTCPVCTSENFELQSNYRGKHIAFAGLKRASCRTCGMVFAHPMPSELALKQYNSSYFSTAHGDSPRSVTGTAFFSGIARLRLEHVRRYLVQNGISVTRLLELGPGPGYFAGTWLEEFPTTDYTAIETDTSCHVALKQLGVKLVDRVLSGASSNALDLIVMSHVLEHVPHPTDFIMEAARGLRDGGVLFIEVPCRDFEHKPVDEPHLLFFDKKPMHHLLRQAGFEKISISYHGVPISRLRSPSRLEAVLMGLRTRLIAKGLVSPFLRLAKGMERLPPLERAVLSPYSAHCESPTPAWWLRAVASKVPVK